MQLKALITLPGLRWFIITCVTFFVLGIWVGLRAKHSVDVEAHETLYEFMADKMPIKWAPVSSDLKLNMPTSFQSGSTLIMVGTIEHIVDKGGEPVVKLSNQVFCTLSNSLSGQIKKQFRKGDHIFVVGEVSQVLSIGVLLSPSYIFPLPEAGEENGVSAQKIDK